MNEISNCDHSNGSYGLVLSCGTVFSFSFFFFFFLSVEGVCVWMKS